MRLDGRTPRKEIMFVLVFVSIAYVIFPALFMSRIEIFRSCWNSLWMRLKGLHVAVKVFSLVFVIYLTVYAAVKPPVEPPAIPPLGLELTPVLVESQISGSTATASKTTSKDTPSILADNGYKRLSENGGSFISRTVTNTALAWLVMPSNAVVYSGWTNYGIAEDTFWVCKTNPAASWDFIYADTLVDGAHVSSSGTISFDVPKGSPTPHEMPDGTGIDFLAPFHTTLSMIPPTGRFWHYATDSNSVRFTWQNFLVGRDTNNAISFQAELFINGDYTFRYAFPLHFLSFTNDFVIGAQFGGVGETYAMNNYSNLADGLDINWDLPDSQLDTDGDGTFDIVEIYYGFDPKAYTPEDWDNDGLSNNFEYYCTNSVPTNGIERLNARLFDSDGDKLPDIFEVTYGFNPLIANATTNETLYADPDNDGLSNVQEMQYGTNPNNNDSDGDYILDGVEVLTNHTDPLDSGNEYSETAVNCIMELSGTDTNDYMLLVMGSSTNILLTSSSSSPISESMKICSTNQQLNVKLSRNLEVQSNDSPILSDVTSRVYTMDPWVITCYGDNYPGYRPPLPYSLNSTITRNSGGGGTSFHIPTMSVDIVSSYSSSYYYYIMCGCNNLSDDLNVAAEVCIESMTELYGTPYIFNPEPITCTATGGGDSIFKEDSDVYTIDLGSTIIDFYNIYEYVYFTLEMGVENLEYFDYDGDYQYNISVEATEEKMGTCSDNVDVPVDIRYSHGSWSITSMLNSSNVINILNSTNASVGIDFHHSECTSYYLNGTLYITPDGNMDIFTLEYVERYVSIEGNDSTSEDFSVIGCSDNLNDIIVDLEFDGDEYHSASYSLTSCALVASNGNSSAEIYPGLEDADNDGTNNVNDLDNAGSLMQILVETHETAISAEFRFDYDSDNLRLWIKDGTEIRTNNVDEIEDGVEYSYNDLFEDGTEQTYYAQALEPGAYNIDVVYMLDGQDLWTNTVSVHSVYVELDIREQAQHENRVGYNDPQHNPSNARNKVLIWGNGNKMINFDLKKPPNVEDTVYVRFEQHAYGQTYTYYAYIVSDSQGCTFSCEDDNDNKDIEIFYGYDLDGDGFLKSGDYIAGSYEVYGVTRKDYTESRRNYFLYFIGLTKMADQLHKIFRNGEFDTPGIKDYRPDVISSVTLNASRFTHNFGGNFTATGFTNILDRMYFSSNATVPKFHYNNNSDSSGLVKDHVEFEAGLNSFIANTNLVTYSIINSAYNSATGGVTRTVELSLDGASFAFGPAGEVGLGGVTINSSPSQPYNGSGTIELQVEKIGSNYKIHSAANIDMIMHDLFDFNYFNLNHAWTDASRSGAMIQNGFDKTGSIEDVGQIALVEIEIEGSVNTNERTLTP